MLFKKLQKRGSRPSGNLSNHVSKEIKDKSLKEQCLTKVLLLTCVKKKVFLHWQKSRYIFWVFAFMVISIIAYVVFIIQVLMYTKNGSPVLTTPLLNTYSIVLS
jgi:hypothetical protein